MAVTQDDAQCAERLSDLTSPSGSRGEGAYARDRIKMTEARRKSLGVIFMPEGLKLR